MGWLIMFAYVLFLNIIEFCSCVSQCIEKLDGLQKPASVIQETLRGGGLDSFPKKPILTFTTLNLISDVKQ